VCIRYDRGGGVTGDSYAGGQYGGQQSRDSRQQQVKDSRYTGDMEVYTGPSSRQSGELNKCEGLIRLHVCLTLLLVFSQTGENFFNARNVLFSHYLFE
jgi:hypothetical protein